MRTLAACLPVLTLLHLAGAADAASPRSTRHTHEISSGPGVLTSSGTGESLKTSADPDTFCLYGGPGSIEGKFATAFPEVVPDDQGWTGVDQTEQPTYWQRSTFYAENLNGNGVGNFAMWCGQDAAQAPGWVDAPGYGNSWNAILLYRQAVTDPSMGQTIDMEFFFNLESEPGYDFLRVDYDSAGTWIETYAGDGYSGGPGGFNPPGRRYTDVKTAEITYGGNDYPDDEIRIRIRGTSDGAWSDQDGLWPTEAGLAQVDDILVQHTDGASFETFEGSAPYQWVPELPPYAGYFGRTFHKIGDNDECVDNSTPVYGFIDDGLGPYNATYSGTGTGGTTAVNWTYGITGGWVVNYNGGISQGLINIDNLVHSPEIAWDLPGTDDDDPTVTGAELRFSLFNHLPLANGIFFQWKVRARAAANPWYDWKDRNFVYYSTWHNGAWENWQKDVSDLLKVSGGPADFVQIAFAVRDLSEVFAFAGTDGTPSPVIDNASLVKYRLPGPAFATRHIDLFQDSFAQSGETDFSSQSSRDNADVALHMARDVSPSMSNVPGDSMIVDVTAVIPGTSVDASGIDLVYALHANPLFENAIRGNLIGAGATETAGGGLHGWNVWTGSIAASISTTSSGSIVPNRYFISPPDVDFLYPGDVFEYYIRAEDSSGNVSTLPRNLDGFGDGVAHDYNRVYTVRALPTATSASDQPEILVLNYGGHAGQEGPQRVAFAQNGLEEGVDYDTYVVKGPSSFVSNGIGSSGVHGATADQLAGYSCLILDGNTSEALLRDGTDSGHSDKGDDYGVLTAWKDQPAGRLLAFFGDQVGYGMSDNGWGTVAGDVFLTNVLGVQYQAKDVAPLLGSKVNPKVTSTGAVAIYATQFIAGSACYDSGIRSIPREMNAISAIPGGPVRTHVFAGSSGNEAAGVVWDRMEGGFRKVSATFPMGLDAMWTPSPSISDGTSARSWVLGETLALSGFHPIAVPTAVNETPVPFAVGAAYPNPFNPKTTVRLTAPRAGRVTVRVFNVRGERVATLLDGEVAAGETLLDWNGRDSNGITVASGMYVLSVDGFGETDRQKLVLLK